MRTTDSTINSDLTDEISLVSDWYSCVQYSFRDLSKNLDCLIADTKASILFRHAVNWPNVLKEVIASLFLPRRYTKMQAW